MGREEENKRGPEAAGNECGTVWVLLNGDLPSQGPCQALGRSSPVMAHLVLLGGNSGAGSRLLCPLSSRACEARA